MYQMLSQTMRAAKTVKRITAKRTAHGIFMIFAPRRARLYRGMVSKQRELSCTDRACEFLLRRTGAAVMLCAAARRTRAVSCARPDAARRRGQGLRRRTVRP